jgi:DNA-binding beta-propeller fold protein YncE
VKYCSRECQKNNWKKHKAQCGVVAGSSQPEPKEHANSAQVEVENRDPVNAGEEITSGHQADAQHVVTKLARKSDLVLGDGTPGGSDNHLNEPWGAAFVPAHPEWLVTTEFGNERVKISNTRTGALICKLGEGGEGKGQFSGPWGVAVSSDSSHLFIAEYDNHRVQVLRLVASADGSSANLKFARFIGDGQGSDAGQLTFPSSAALLPDARGQETVLVLEEGNHRISQFTLAGSFMRIFAGDGRVELGSHRMSQAQQGDTLKEKGPKEKDQTTLDGSFVRLFANGAGAHSGSGDGQLHSPTGITVTGSSGEVAVVDASNNRVQIFDSEGNYKRQFGRKGKKADGDLFSPSDITSDAHGNLIVLDMTNRLQVFSPEGRHVCTRSDLGLCCTEDSMKSIAWSACGGIAVLDGGTHNCLLWGVSK